MAKNTINKRFPKIPYKDLQGNQKEIYDMSNAMCEKMFSDTFVYKDEDGALLGPFMPLFYVPTAITLHFLNLTKNLSTIPGLTAYARETAILKVGGHFGALFEVYSHERVAIKMTELTQAQVDKLKVGKKPEGLTEEGEVAFDVAGGLLEEPKGPMSDALWARAEKAFGQSGAQALIHYIGMYSYVSILLNGCGCPLPDGEKIVGQ